MNRLLKTWNFEILEATREGKTVGSVRLTMVGSDGEKFDAIVIDAPFDAGAGESENPWNTFLEHVLRCERELGLIRKEALS